MDLSIIIVNYNVKHFLEQCLLSVEKAMHAIDGEVIVVDNNSVDGSQEMLGEKFGDKITLIANTDNPGFSKANNQGIKISQGRYVLLLNPDTVVEEQTFQKCIDFMDAHPDGGALGVKMIDGEGKFLPESKRALPTPWVSFYKIFGLAKLFPQSKKFGQYHLTYLDKEENHPIEILSGAFMFMRSEALEKIGYLDEDFFMYGEDIDLSYRFIKEGYQNYYLSDTQIIHYKGESTKKGSLNYVRVFYQAMIIFAQKHFGGSRKQLFIASIRMAVYMRALAAIMHRMLKRFGFPILETLLIFLTTFGIKNYWEHNVKYIEGGAYPEEFSYLYMPAYALVFVVFLWLAGAYQKPYKIRPLVMAPIWGFIAIATITYMFDPIRNFSRGIVGLSAVFSMVITMGTRGFINWREHGTFFFTESRTKRVAIIGQGADVRRVVDLIRGELDYPVEIVGSVGVEAKVEANATSDGIEKLGDLSRLQEIIRFYDLDEVIFSNASVATEDILDTMRDLHNSAIAYKIVPPQADYIVGPQAIHTSRYSRQIGFRLEETDVLWRKQVFDSVSSGLLLLSYPLLFWLYQRPVSAFGRLWQVFSRKQHMVGYIHPQTEELPPLKRGLLNMLDRAKGTTKDLNTRGLDKYYARQYRWEMDLEILLKAWRRIGG
ncbi:MAG: glycosyltransferase [Bacteroidia bacterium]